jgi:hypothetical protein
LNDNIEYNGEQYELDSVILNNWNTNSDLMDHVIAGITCENQRYVYNGWTRYTQDPTIDKTKQKTFSKYPCELMKFNWNVKQNNDFCLNLQKCNLPKPAKNKKGDVISNLCFSFNKGDRILVYVKKSKLDTVGDKKSIENIKSSIKSSMKSSSPKSIKKNNKQFEPCPDGKIRNPLTKRCVKIDGAVSKKLKLVKVDKSDKVNKVDKVDKADKADKADAQKSKRSKPCPDGKFRNPITNRCKKMKNQK